MKTSLTLLAGLLLVSNLPLCGEDLATLDGQQYNAIVTWSLFGQRWVVNIYSLQSVWVLSKPLRSSPQNYNINLIEGYFTTSSLVYREASNNFEVSP